MWLKPDVFKKLSEVSLLQKNYQTQNLVEANFTMLNSKQLDLMEFVNHELAPLRNEEGKGYHSSNQQVRNIVILDNEYRKLFTPQILWNGLSAIDFMQDSRAVSSALEEIKNERRKLKDKDLLQYLYSRYDN